MATTINPSDQTITQYNIQTGGASNLLNNVAPSSTSGVPVISQGAASQPIFGTAVVAGGGTGAVTLTNHGVLIGQATSAIVATAAGSAGQVLQSGGASADPTYSTATYPATAGTSGNVLTSDGTNWTSATPTGGSATINSTTINLSNAQLKALGTTGIQIVAAQGSGIVIRVLSWTMKLVYGGTNAFTNSPTFYFQTNSTGAGTNFIALYNNTSFPQETANTYATGTAIASSGASDTGLISAANSENKGLFIMSSASLTGNAANNNTMVVNVQWYTITI